MAERVFGHGTDIGNFPIDFQDVRLGDNEPIIFGDSTDNAIWHDATDSGNFVFDSHYDTTTSNYQFRGGDATFDGNIYAANLQTSVLTVNDKDATHNLDTTDSGQVFTNDGATTGIQFNLPSAGPVGAHYTFIVKDSYNLRIDTTAGEYIQMGAILSSSGGYVDSSAVGSSIHLLYTDSTWITTSVVGSWYTV